MPVLMSLQPEVKDPMSTTKNNTLTSLIGLTVTLGFAALPLSRWVNEFAGTTHLIGYDLLWWGLAALILAYVRMVERRPLSSIGLKRPSAAQLLQSVGMGLLGVAGLALIYLLILPALHLTEAQQVNQLKTAPAWWLMLSVIRAAVVEELMFRGYALERLRELTGHLNLAALVTWAVFTVEHVGVWGWSHLIVAGFGGLLLTGWYLKTRNLYAAMLMHFVIDGLSLLAA